MVSSGGGSWVRALDPRPHHGSWVSRGKLPWKIKGKEEGEEKMNEEKKTCCGVEVNDEGEDFRIWGRQERSREKRELRK